MTIAKQYKFVLLLTVIITQSVCVLAQKTVSELKDELDKTSSVKERVDICYSICGYYLNRLKVDSALFFANKIKEISTPTSYATGLGIHYLATASALKLRRKTDEARANLQRSISIFTQEKDFKFLGRSYNTLASTYVLDGTYDLSRENYRLAIANSSIAGDDNSLVREYYDAAKVFQRFLETDSAIIYYTKGLVIAEKIKSQNSIFMIAGDLGLLFLDGEDLYKAKNFLEYSLKNYTPSSDRVALRLQLGHYADCLIKFSEYEKADSVLHVIQQINAQFKDDWSTAFLDGLKGDLQFAKHNYQQALTHFVRSREQIISKGMDVSFRSIILNHGKTEFMLKNYDNAILYLKEAKQLYQVINSVQFESDVDYFLAACFERKGRSDSALHYFKNYASLKDSAQSLEKQKTVIEVSTKYETEKKEQEIKLLQKESEANALLLRLKNQQIVEQQLEDDKKSQQLILVSQQNEINKLDASKKTLSLENETKENEKSQAKLRLLEQEAAYQKLLASKQSQQKKIIYISILAALALSAYMLYRYTRKKRIQNQQEVLNERLRISRELHDEVGSTLSGIAMYSHLTKEQIKGSKTQEVEKSLNNIQQSAGDMVNKLSDIVWLVNPEKDSLQKLIERLEQYTEDMASIKGMEVKVSVTPGIANINLTVEKRRNIYLFCKEAINNAVKYSDANIIGLSMKESGNKVIEIAVIDNGHGFTRSTVKNGNGLVNMEQRAKEMGAVYLLDTSPGNGTKVSLTLKIT